MKPELSTKQKRIRAGKAGAAKSHWRFGFGGPLSPRDKGWAERVSKFMEKTNGEAKGRGD